VVDLEGAVTDAEALLEKVLQFFTGRRVQA
jgi:hypothetical protein